MELLYYPHKILQTPANLVEVFDNDLAVLVEQMKQCMVINNGIGLAAPQVGISKQVLVYGGEKIGLPLKCLVNPKLIQTGQDKEIAQEGCLSFPGVYIEIERWKTVKLLAQNERGQEIEFNVKDLEARIIQHEINHLQGLTFLDQISKLKRDMIKKKLSKDWRFNERRR